VTLSPHDDLDRHPFQPLFVNFCIRAVKVKNAICNQAVMSVLLSVCNKPRPLTSQTIISSNQAYAKFPGDEHRVFIVFNRWIYINRGANKNNNNDDDNDSCTMQKQSSQTMMIV